MGVECKKKKEKDYSVNVGDDNTVYFRCTI